MADHILSSRDFIPGRTEVTEAAASLVSIPYLAAASVVEAGGCAPGASPPSNQPLKVCILSILKQSCKNPYVVELVHK